MMLDRMSAQLAETNAHLYNEQNNLVRKGGYIRRMKNKLRPFSFDAALYVILNRDVFKTAEEQKQALRTMKEAVEWANRDYKKEFAKLKKLEEEYHTHCMNIDILRGNIKTIEENIDVIKLRIREFDNKEKKDNGV